jgi:hypothetical protein
MLSHFNAAFAEWLASRPPCVQHLAMLFPLGSPVRRDGRVVWVIGYTEHDGLVVSPVHPTDDAQESWKQRHIYFAENVRER